MTERRLARGQFVSAGKCSPADHARAWNSRRPDSRYFHARRLLHHAEKELSPGTEVDFTLTLPAEITRGSEVFVRPRTRGPRG